MIISDLILDPTHHCHSKRGFADGVEYTETLLSKSDYVASVIILGLTGFALLPGPIIAILAVALVLTVAGSIFVVSQKASRLASLPILSRWTGLLRDSQEGFKELAAPKVMATGVLIGAVAWFAEGLALWVILKGIGSDIDLVRALPIYAAATLVGAVTALPGGLV